MRAARECQHVLLIPGEKPDHVMDSIPTIMDALPHSMSRWMWV
jgi:hypothetical protein